MKQSHTFGRIITNITKHMYFMRRINTLQHMLYTNTTLPKYYKRRKQKAYRLYCTNHRFILIRIKHKLEKK